MNKLCRQILSPADTGDYELHVRLEGSTATTVLGDRAVNGVQVEAWTNTQLLHNGPQRFSVAIGERHRITVVATFMDTQGKAIVEVKRAGQPAVILKCELKRSADTIADISVIAAKAAA